MIDFTLPPLASYLRETENSLIVAAVRLCLTWDDLDPIERQLHSQAIRLLFKIHSGRTSDADRATAYRALALLIKETETP